MLTENGLNGVFLGRSLFQVHGEIGGAKHVFVKIQGSKDDIVFPTYGGRVMNPFKGAAKFFAGDLAEFRPDDDGRDPKYYLLKVYKVKSQSSQTVVLYRDKFAHKPFIGDILMKAPDEIGGTGAASTVTAVTKGNDGTDDIWTLTLGDTNVTGLTDGDILVEADEAGASATMLVQNINSVAGCDYDFLYNPVADPADDDDEFESARYNIALQLGGMMYRSKMSPIPSCVEKFNLANVNGWFRVDYKFPVGLL